MFSVVRTVPGFLVAVCSVLVLNLNACATPAPKAPPVKLAISQSERGVMLWLPDNVLFEFGRATLNSSLSDPYMDRVAQLLKEKTVKAVSLEGHTDSIGAENANLVLSVSRATAVRQALLDRQVPEARLSAIGYGFAKPIAPNDSELGRRLNRRVEIIILDEQVENLTRGEPEGAFEEAFSKLKGQLESLFKPRQESTAK
ncbi:MULTISPECIES: OmpA family protein [Zoogloea]|nr:MULTISPECIES: OmpA family protein [Zoogloea]MBT9499229.1 OmpA family protein [Zoogloea sp.]MDD2667686.1 OmpA family protein [Zoogloea sp.]MDY0034926.1 OmpA family protein [Zoogloea oleivorans]